MDTTIDQAKLKVRQWTTAHRQAVLYDENSSTLRDVATGRTIRLPWREVTAFAEKTHPETGEKYLVLVFENGRQIALVDPGGVAFAPSTENSGPLEGLPSVVCLRNFFTLKQRIDHYLYDHRDQEPPRECVDLIMMSIAILDGARRVGFDVGDLEGDLEMTLNGLERRRNYK